MPSVVKRIAPVESTEKPRRPVTAHLIAKVYDVDQLLCTRCGQRMSIVAYVTDAFSIRRILDHLVLENPATYNAALIEFLAAGSWRTEIVSARQ